MYVKERGFQISELAHDYFKLFCLEGSEKVKVYGTLFTHIWKLSPLRAIVLQTMPMCAKQCDVKFGALTDHSLLQNIELENTPLRIV